MEINCAAKQKDQLKSATVKLLGYCKQNNWAGFDPYDALNSKIFKALPFLNFRIPRLVLTQTLKRSPVNLRHLLLVPKEQNPKAIGLFLSALIKLYANGLVNLTEIDQMIARLAALRSPGHSYWCWGYNFPWQMRDEIVPACAPNLVGTTFVANSLLDAYDQRQDSNYLSMAVSAAEYVVNDLYWTRNAAAGFRYPLPTKAFEVSVHNANFLGGAFLCRVFKRTGERKFLDAALRVARYSASTQRTDGSWDYGEGSKQRWIDNFHSGYNLCALQEIGRYAETPEFDARIERGFQFYRNNFFREDGAPKYFHNRTFPIDIHSVAQSIITLLAFKDLDSNNLTQANKVLTWAMNHMWDDRGFFYYRVLRSCTIRTSYMRWSQAWMLLAMSTFLRESDVGKPSPSIYKSKLFINAR